MGELVNKNIITSISNKEKKEINIILDSVKNKDDFKAKVINNIRKNKLKSVI